MKVSATEFRTTMKVLGYHAAVGSRLSDEDAKKIGPIIINLTKKHHSLTPHLVLAEAKKKSSPLHRYYNWDKNHAAEQYWLNHSRLLMRSIRVEIKIEHDGHEETLETGAFYPITIEHDDETKNEYLPTEIAITGGRIEDLFNTAFRELQQWRKRWKAYKSFPAFAEIRDFL